MCRYQKAKLAIGNWPLGSEMKVHNEHKIPDGTYTTIAHVYLQAQDPLILEDTSALQS